MNDMILNTSRHQPLRLDALPSFQPVVATLEKEHIVAFDSRDIRSRPFNIMRTKFTKQLELQKMRMIGITSPAPAAGKSCLSTNLAAALARLNDHTIILADFDIRRGSVANTLGLEFEHGITDWLEGKVDRIEDIAYKVDGVPLVIMPTQFTTEDSTTYLSGERYDTLMEWLRVQSRDCIVLADLPPVFANDDAMLLMESLDGYMMVVESGKTTARQLTDASDLLKPAISIGSVLNRYKGGVLDSYGYGKSAAAYARYYNR